MGVKVRFTLVVDVHLFLVKDGKILLLLRKNTGYEDGKYHVPAGHMDGSEPVTTALVRESKEEIGISIKREDVKLVHIMHSVDSKERMGFFFEVKKWNGEIKNMEPEKHGDVKWFEINKLPKNMVAYAKYAIKCCKKGQLLSEYGWNKK
ncbi:MAG: NUDIX domain-containing protein [Patescibacteria group bacterium]